MQFIRLLVGMDAKQQQSPTQNSSRSSFTGDAMEECAGVPLLILGRDNGGGHRQKGVKL